jgi:hypothetical protein
MSNNTITLTLEGDVSLAAFSEATVSLSELLNGLNMAVAAEDKIIWTVDDLQYGSTLLATRGETTDGTQRPVLRVVTEFERTVGALAAGRTLPIASLTAPAHRLRRVVQRPVTTMVIVTEEATFQIDAQDHVVAAAPPVASPWPPAYGSVTGVIHTLSDRGRLRFTLYDSLTDRAVTCFLSEGQQDMMRGAWGKTAIVEGVVDREPASGRPRAVRNVTRVVALPDMATDTWTRARGVIPWEAGDELPEDVIRRWRDA